MKTVVMTATLIDNLKYDSKSSSNNNGGRFGTLTPSPPYVYANDYNNR